MRIYPPIQYGLIIGADLVRLLHRRRIQQYRQIFKSVFLLLVSDDSAFFVVIFSRRCRNTFIYHTPNGIHGGGRDTQTRFTILSKTYFRKIDRCRYIKPSTGVATSFCLHKPNLTTYNILQLHTAHAGGRPRNSKSPAIRPFSPKRSGWALSRLIARCASKSDVTAGRGAQRA